MRLLTPTASAAFAAPPKCFISSDGFMPRIYPIKITCAIISQCAIVATEDTFNGGNMTVTDQLHRDLTKDALEYAKEVQQQYRDMTEEQQRAALGWMRVYKHMLENWEGK